MRRGWYPQPFTLPHQGNICRAAVQAMEKAGIGCGFMKEVGVKVWLVFAGCFCAGLLLFALLYNGFGISQPAAVPQQAQGAISQVAAAVSPSVVGISNFRQQGDVYDQISVESTASGVIIDAEGHIVTNHHVIQGADRITVTLADGVEKEARLIGADPHTDLALIKIPGDGQLTPIAFGDSEQLAVGQQVLAIGNPLGMRFARSVTAGIVSGLNRLLATEDGRPFRLIQTDAAINPGNSGGALVTLDGQLIGINTVKIAAAGFEGMGFAIPSNQVQEVVEQLKHHGRVIRPVLGIRMLGEINGELARHFNLPSPSGVVVEPLPDGPAAKAGIKAYDIIISIDNEDVGTSLELQEKIASRKAGQTVEVKLLRLVGGDVAQAQIMTVPVILQES
ncbi:MAG: PDZ domain-containing protein [Syntrophomonadaceae bacterium]|nr:PDZ domain-containing protein [Syntrophomonadaceae bacterium]